MIDAAKVLGEIVGLLGGLGAFLGVFGVALTLVTLLALGFINAISPLSRRVNFFLAVGLVTAAALLQAIRSDDIGDQVQQMLPYFAVMLGPYVLATGLGTALRRRGKSDSQNRMQRIEALTDEINREIASMKKWG